MSTAKAWEHTLPRPVNCFWKTRVGYTVGLGFVSRNTCRNIRGRAQGKVQLLPLIIVVRTRLHRGATTGWLTWETLSLCGWSSWSGGRACRWPSACSTRPPAVAGSPTPSGCSRRESPRSRTPWQHSSRGAWCTHPCEWGKGCVCMCMWKGGGRGWIGKGKLWEGFIYNQHLAIKHCFINACSQATYICGLGMRLIYPHVACTCFMSLYTDIKVQYVCYTSTSQ